MLFCSALGFVVMDDVYRHKAYLLPFAIVVCVGFLVSLRRAHNLWSRIGTHGDSDSLPLRIRRTLLQGLAIFSILSLAGGMLIGAMVGQSGMKTESYIDDIAVYASTGKRISQARSTAEQTIEGQLEMYRKIEADVVALKPVIDRLKEENAEYASRYPAAHQTTSDSAAAFARTGKRDELLLRQIAVAKEIENVVGHENQLAIYREKMMPILTAEDQIDGR
jgi:hypothetical protein